MRRAVLPKRGETRIRPFIAFSQSHLAKSWLLENAIDSRMRITSKPIGASGFSRG